jgi:hypothetical protein
MLAQGVPDPYCRFISPAEFASMRKYDVTGVGLNLGTAEEFVKKTVRAEGGAWLGQGTALRLRLLWVLVVWRTCWWQATPLHKTKKIIH